MLIASLGFAQVDPEDACKEAGDYYSEDLAQCFVVNDMDEDQRVLLREIRKLDLQKRQRLHEQQDYSANAQTFRLAQIDARLASLAAKRDAAVSQKAKDTFQAQIDRLTARRQEHVDFDVSQHGQIISALSQEISDLSTDLDNLLTQ
jgi:hypothetical protein